MLLFLRQRAITTTYIVVIYRMDLNICRLVGFTESPEVCLPRIQKGNISIWVKSNKEGKSRDLSSRERETVVRRKCDLQSCS